MPFDWGWMLFPTVAVMWLLIPLAIIWSMAWKGVALWRAARNGHLIWFIALFIFNTLGILPMIYIFAFSQKEGKISPYQGEGILH
jgi:hypothetical protein